MKPRQDQSKKKRPEARKETKEQKRRFQIVKLEERIAPRACGYIGHGHGHRICYRG